MNFIKPRSCVSIVILLLALPLIAMEDSSSLLHDAKKGRLTGIEGVSPQNPKSLINICCKKYAIREFKISKQALIRCGSMPNYLMSCKSFLGIH
jgi:hypothetical protein